MSNDQLAIFTDRREAIALFDLLRGRDPGKPWPLLPIVAFVAPGGSGKSLLLRYLRVKKCSLPDGHAAIPYAYLDFTLPHAPKELLPILMELRDQLQQQDDGQGNHLVFPRFDLGALIAQAASSNEDIASLGPTQVRQKLTAGMQIIEALSAVGSSLEVRTREAFPVDWAMTQNSLGLAYGQLPAGDREANLRRAIACFEAALEVRTREAFPVDWAMTQNNLGLAYSDLPAGDREANLRRAIACYEAALLVFQLVHVDYYARVVNGNLESARDELRSLEQGELQDQEEV